MRQWALRLVAYGLAWVLGMCAVFAAFTRWLRTEPRRTFRTVS